jgi:hypothetical protein
MKDHNPVYQKYIFREIIQAAREDSAAAQVIVAHSASLAPG